MRVSFGLVLLGFGFLGALGLADFTDTDFSDWDWNLFIAGFVIAAGANLLGTAWDRRWDGLVTKRPHQGDTNQAGVVDSALQVVITPGRRD